MSETAIPRIGRTRPAVIHYSGASREDIGRRAARPDQPPPQQTSRARAARGAGHRDDDDEGETERAAGKTHSARMATAAAHWADREPANMDMYQRCFPEHLRQQEERCKQQLATAQLAVDAAAAAVAAGHGINCDTCVVVSKTRSVIYVGMGFKGVLSVPTLTCTECSAVGTVHPYRASCVPTSPTDACETWIAMDVVHLFNYLYHSNGLAADGECPALHLLTVSYSSALAPAGQRSLVHALNSARSTSLQPGSTQWPIWSCATSLVARR